MDWLLALMLTFQSLSGASDAQAKADLLEQQRLAQEQERIALEQERVNAAEKALFANPQQADAVLSQAVALLPAVVYQGDAVLVRSKEKGSIRWQNKTYELQPLHQGHYALLPVQAETKPGSYDILGRTLTVKSKKFDEDRITVSKEQEAMRQDTARIAADQKKIDAARSKSAPAFLFDTPFVIPTKGRLSTPYGYTRYVNDKFDGTHKAIDIAAPTGTPVKATNAGKVVLADSLYLTGNSVYIDHGMRLFSQYAHLSKLYVKTGDEVKAGEVIGEVGTTGFSTGPHLHFAMWIGNTQTNPNLFFDTTPFRWTDK